MHQRLQQGQKWWRSCRKRHVRRCSKIRFLKSTVVPIFTTTMMKRLLGLLGDNTKEVSVAEKAIGGQRWVAVVGGSACFLCGGGPQKKESCRRNIVTSLTKPVPRDTPYCLRTPLFSWYGYRCGSVQLIIMTSPQKTRANDGRDSTNTRTRPNRRNTL